MDKKKRTLKNPPYIGVTGHVFRPNVCVVFSRMEREKKKKKKKKKTHTHLNLNLKKSAASTPIR